MHAKRSVLVPSLPFLHDVSHISVRYYRLGPALSVIQIWRGPLWNIYSPETTPSNAVSSANASNYPCGGGPMQPSHDPKQRAKE